MKIGFLIYFYVIGIVLIRVQNYKWVLNVFFFG
jgi:hypothetical protein